MTEDARVSAARPPWLDRSEYPFESRWINLPSGSRMHYVDQGSGDTVLLVHGTPTWSFEWRRVIRGLSPSLRCVAPDHLGFGLSDRPKEGDYTPEWHARNLTDFADQLGLRDITLVVHDFGGPIGLPLALNRPGFVKRLVILNTFMWSLRDDKGVRRAARIVDSDFGRFLYRRANFSLRVITPGAFADKKKLTREVHAHYLAPFPDPESRERVLWSLAHALFGSTPFYESLWGRRERLRGIPALIVWGMRDPAFRPHQLARWKEALPHAQVLELPVGHWPQ
jgi:haloalkane dehalogenase